MILRKSLTSLLAAVSAISLGLSTPARAEAPTASDDFGPIGLQAGMGDPTVKPGDDFNRYVNGKWLATFQIPADKSTYGAFTMLSDRSLDRVHALLDAAVAAKAAPDSATGKIAAAYSAFMDTSAINAAGLAPARAWLDRIAAARTGADLFALFADPAFASPIGFAQSVDAKDSDHYALYVGNGALGLPDRDYYLVDNPKNLEIRAKYKEWLTFAFTRVGDATPAATADAVIALETRLAREHWDRALGRNRDLTYNKLSLAEAQAQLPGLPLAQVIAALGATDVQNIVVAQLPPTAEELAAAKYTPEMAAKLGGGVPAIARLVNDQPIAVWKAWLTAQFISSYASVLPADIENARFAFYGKVLAGQPELAVRWKRGVGAVERQVGDLVGQMYAARYFPPESKAAMTQLIGNLRAAMASNLAELKWMGPETRKEAQAKLAAFTPKIGEPTKYKDYAGLVLSPTTPLANTIAAQAWRQHYDMSRVGQPVDKTEWSMLPETVNAYYAPTRNEIVFPAAILQPPFFNPTADAAVNYGAIGAVIGHEMGHGFDDQGSKSDGQGNLRNWWTDADRAAFEGLTSRLVAQYNAFCPFDEGKTCVNGRLTLGENIGDLGGLSLAYKAYKLSLKGKPAPVIGGLTGDQRFFLSWAQQWRSLSREPQARQLLLTDPHSPPAFRINGVVRNFDEWYRAFNVKPGDALYLPPDQRVRIW